jgi:hypothetical protein
VHHPSRERRRGRRGRRGEKQREEEEGRAAHWWIWGPPTVDLPVMRSGGGGGNLGLGFVELEVGGW